MLDVGVAKELGYVMKAKMGVVVIFVDEAVVMVVHVVGYPEDGTRTKYFLQAMVEM